MDLHPDPLHAGVTKRIRQACASCRRRKTKCSGERPLCSHCRRNRQRCVYEPYSMTIGDGPPAPAPATYPPDNTELLHRINRLESRLAELTDRSLSQAAPFVSHGPSAVHQISLSRVPSSLVDPVPSAPRFNSEHFSLPPLPVLQSVIETFFVHVHNQPYSYIQEASFRQKLETDTLPNCLLLAVLASAVRFSSHEYYGGQRLEATEVYARESWMSVLMEHLMAADNLNLEVVQAVNMLAIVDYTAGRVSSAWLKIGLAARVSQDLRLMAEPSGFLSFTEQEERRRLFWSGYLLDRLISCGKSRPLAIHDDDCNVQLPCDEESIQMMGQRQNTHTLHELLSWDSKTNDSPSPFGLVILMASIFGRCTRYVHRDLIPERMPPWDTTSEFSSINSLLLLTESYFKRDQASLFGYIYEAKRSPQSQAGHLIFAHTLFHLCHCLLNHPFLIRLRLKPFRSKIPESFAIRTLQTGSDHARQLLDLHREATQSGYLVQSSFYPYCIVIAGGIESLVFHSEESRTGLPSSQPSQHFSHSVNTLESLGNFWAHAANMAIRLREFHAQAQTFPALLDADSLAEDLNATVEEALWSMIDYGVVGAGTGPTPIARRNSLSHLASPSSWALGSEIFSAPLEGFDGANTHLLDPVATPTHFDQVNNILDSTNSHPI
ncbi:hypothetical protein ARAM_002011 [Aspergillus rambellii]|uniref:Zn(2)-C6 fungal-type domain-containing protein n=1 Tax=Aspergillus rambellii TaxID=308745 RepID=A0A0F8UWK5_9EURO|nr:hypothetical protein ARAM_002011 [Aspergillus rambellii]